MNFILACPARLTASFCILAIVGEVFLSPEPSPKVTGFDCHLA
jgi:hypothetical protein